MVPLSPAYTVTDDPVVVLLPLDTDDPDVALLVKLALATVAVSPVLPLVHCLASVSVALLRAFATNERINQFLLDAIDASIWPALPQDAKTKQARTIASIVGSGKATR